MNLIKSLQKIKQIYAQGGNMIEFMRGINNTETNSLESIMISYDFQAGNYIKKTELLNDFENECVSKIVAQFDQFKDYDSILEIGVGEATTLARVLTKLNRNLHSYGFDISWSRIKYAMSHLKKAKFGKVNLFVGDLFNIPLRDNSIDLVYTWHSLEPNGQKEADALKELYRVTSKYLFVFEPSYELGNDDTRRHIDKHGFVKNLYKTAKDLGYEIVDHKLIIEKNPLNFNNTSVLIIRKEGGVNATGARFMCPISKAPLEVIRKNYYCEESMLLYPVVDGIPCLLPSNAIIATHYMDNFS